MQHRPRSSLAALAMSWKHPRRDSNPQSSDWRSDGLSIRPRGHTHRGLRVLATTGVCFAVLGFGVGGQRARATTANSDPFAGRGFGLRQGALARRVGGGATTTTRAGAARKRALHEQKCAGWVFKVGVFSVKSEGYITPALHTFGRVLKAGALSIKTVGFFRSEVLY